MKKLIFIPLILISSLSFGQKYYPLPEENAVWQDIFSTQSMNISSSIWKVHYFDGDTIINNQSYKKVYLDFHKGVTDATAVTYTNEIQLKQYDLALRQDTSERKIYFIPKGFTQEYLYFDFSAQIGDIVTYPSYYGGNYVWFCSIQVSQIDSVLVGDGTYRRRIGAFVEGIGNTDAFVYPEVPDHMDLQCMSVNGIHLYGSLDSCCAPGIVCGYTPVQEPINMDVGYAMDQYLTSDGITFKIRNEQFTPLTFQIVDVLGRIEASMPINATSQFSFNKGELSGSVHIATLSLNNHIIATSKFMIE